MLRSVAIPSEHDERLDANTRHVVNNLRRRRLRVDGHGARARAHRQQRNTELGTVGKDHSDAIARSNAVSVVKIQSKQRKGVTDEG